ncbi:MAG: hypothetical protein JW731_00030 [Bacteroidales bacterium]|nr:hypothetical protein [Bacteroidales bacterium]
MKNLPVTPAKIIITVLRMGIGWHFIFEGILKILSGNWTANAYLANSTGFLSGFYQFLASSPALLKVVDVLNMYGLLLIGLALFLGIVIRFATMAGALLLMLYYFAYPPFGISIFSIGEGYRYIVDKNLIEAVALLLLFFIPEKGYGFYALKGLLPDRLKRKTTQEGQVVPINTRRETLKNMAALPLLGVMGWGAFKIQSEGEVDVMSGATIKVNASALTDLKGELPRGKLGNHEISRLVLGGNLIGGWSHGRDLIYTSSLFKAYNTEKKIYETLELAQKAGINTINIGFPSNPVLAKYKKVYGGKIQVISQVGHNSDVGDIYEKINQAIDHGVDIIQVIGNSCDSLVMDNQVDVIGKMIDKIRSQGYTAGLGAHAVQSLETCKENGIIPDYYMLTMHHDNYWSAHPYENRRTFEVMEKSNRKYGSWNDNMWCTYPEKAVEFVKNSEIPVMGFKVLAAGAIYPKDGFKWAFENGADFICVGMFDFQIVNDVNIAIDVLNSLSERQRKWYA